MKYKIFIYLILVAVGVSCTDLDVFPEDKTISEVLLTETDNYTGFMARLYAGLAVTGQDGPAGDADIKGLDEGFSNYFRQYWQFQEITTDEAVIGWGDDGLPDLHEHSWGSSNQFARAIYFRIFFQVSITNEFLRESTSDLLTSRGIPEADFDLINQYRAEARFLRALSYWHGLDLFANIPFYTEEAAFGASPPPQATAQEIFDFVESELTAIESSMGDPGSVPYGRADKAALWTLQAKLYLNAITYVGQNRYSDCVAACNKIISSGTYSLHPNYRDLFKADNHSSPEIIFPIRFDGLSTQTWGGMTYLVHAPVGGMMQDDLFDDSGEPYPEGEIEAATLYGIGGGWGGLRTTSALVDRFPDVTGEIDSRAIFYTNGQSKEINDISNFNDGYAVPKYVNVTSDGQIGSDLTHIDTDFPLFRLADVYLMYAEAVLRGGSGGDLNTALGYVNELRERAYGNALGNIALSNLTEGFILEERSRELYWEGHRRTDLIRYGQFAENGVWPWKGGVKEGVTTDAKYNLLPIPAEEILGNPNLQQNPGY